MLLTLFQNLAISPYSFENGLVIQIDESFILEEKFKPKIFVNKNLSLKNISNQVSNEEEFGSSFYSIEPIFEDEKPHYLYRYNFMVDLPEYHDDIKYNKSYLMTLECCDGKWGLSIGSGNEGFYIDLPLFKPDFSKSLELSVK